MDTVSCPSEALEWFLENEGILRCEFQFHGKRLRGDCLSYWEAERFYDACLRDMLTCELENIWEVRAERDALAAKCDRFEKALRLISEAPCEEIVAKCGCMASAHDRGGGRGLQWRHDQEANVYMIIATDALFAERAEESDE